MSRAAALPSGRAWDLDPEGNSGARRIVLVALALGLLRFWRLGEWSLWIDEALTWTDYFVGIEGGEIKNPLGYYWIHATVELCGGVPSEFSLRLLPAVAGWASIAATAWAFRPLVGARTAAWAALFVALSSWQVYWSQNARFYTLAEFTSLVGAGIFLRGLSGRRMLLAWCGLALSVGAGAFHPSAALVLVPLLVAPWIALGRAGGADEAAQAAERRLLRRSALVALGVALAGAAWAHETLANYFRQKGDANPFDDLGQVAGRVAHLAKTTGFYMTPLLGAAALVGFVLAWRRRSHAGILAGVFVACGLALAGALAIAGARMTAQYVFVFFPWVALLAALAGESLAVRTPAVARGFAFVLATSALVTTGLYFTVRRGERPAWREAYHYVWNQKGEDDLVLGMEASVGEFYLAPWRTNLRQPEQVQWLDRWRARLPEHWARTSRRMWLIVNPEQFLDWNPADAADVQRFLREECRLMKVWPLYVESRDLSVWVYVRD